MRGNGRRRINYWANWHNRQDNIMRTIVGKTAFIWKIIRQIKIVPKLLSCLLYFAIQKVMIQKPFLVYLFIKFLAMCNNEKENKEKTWNQGHRDLITLLENDLKFDSNINLCLLLILFLEGPLAPGALTKNLIKVQSHCVLGNQTFNLSSEAIRENPHQRLGSEAILGTLLVVTLTLESQWNLS